MVDARLIEVMKQVVNASRCEYHQPATPGSPPNVIQTAVSTLEALDGRASLALQYAVRVAGQELTTSCGHHECHDAERGVNPLHLCGRRFTAERTGLSEMIVDVRVAGHGSTR